MRTSITHRKQIVSAAAVVAMGLLASSAQAASGTWNPIGPPAGDGTTWSDVNNWLGGIVADGSGFTANFSTIDPLADVTINVDAPHTLTNLIFGDTDFVTTPAGWTLSGSDITLAGTTPTITVGALGTGKSVTFSNVVSGTAGLTKAGVGELILGGVNTFTGGLKINTGTVNTSTGGTIAAQAVTLSGGGTWHQAADWGIAAGSSISVAAGQTGNLMVDGARAIQNVGAGGALSTLNLIIGGSTVTARGGWASGTALSALNITSPSGPGTFRIGSNGGGGGSNFTANSFLSTAVNIGPNVTVFTRSGSAGNTLDIGSLAGDSSAILFGGRESTGSFVTYSIGSLNTNSEYAGTITSEYQTSNSLNGTTNITKVGSGTLTLSGTLSYVPSQNTTGNRRGAVTTISAGTLALKSAATIPGGDTAINPSTLDIKSGATLDVSLTTNTFTDASSAVVTGYSSQPFQQILGTGTIVGTFNHAAGVIAPGNTLKNNTTTISNNAIAGTLNFSGNLNMIGTGTILFDVTPSTVSGNDLIQVNGGNMTGTPTLQLNTIGGIGVGSYTIINSANNLTGSTAGWIVPWLGRGTPPTLDMTSDPKKVQLVVGAGAFGTVNWQGGTDANWDINTTFNWHNTAVAAPNPDKYFETDNVAFLDTYDGVNAPANTSINLAGAVNPTSVVVNSSAVTYSITGAGRISGSTSLLKQGTSTLTLNGNNDYTGTTTIEGGGAIVGRIGAGTLTLNNGTFSATTGTGISAVVVTAATNNNITTGASTVVVGPLSGSGNLTVNSGGTVDLTGINTLFTGVVTVDSGTVRVNSGVNNGSTFKWNLQNSGILANSSNGAGTASLGALEGTGGTLSGYQGGSTATNKTWDIGGLNTSTTFAGTIADGKPASTTSINKVGTGTLTLSGPLNYTGLTTVTAGKLVTVNALQNLATRAVTINGGTLEVPVNGGSTGVTSIGTLVMAANGPNYAGVLELHDNDLVVSYGANPSVYPAILNQVKSGLPLLGFAGDGTGITSAEIQAQTLPGTMLGVVDGGATGGLVTSLSGFTVVNPTTSVLVKYTWRGDANLDGVVNGSDYALADTGFSGGGTGWFYGDMNYDGVINGSDYALIDTGFSSQTGPLPEPATLSLLGLGAMGMLRRRRAM